MFYMIRHFDQAGYYETRLLLMIAGLAIAFYYLRAREDRNFLIMFVSGTIWQGLMELVLQLLGLRGEDYVVRLFGWSLPSSLVWLFQGVTEGGILALVGYWFFDLYRSKWPARDRRAYLGTLVFIVVLSTIVSLLARGEPISSARPMFRASALLPLFYIIMASLLIVALKGHPAFRHLSIYYLGSLIYVLVTFVPFQVMSIRYIGVEAADGSFALAGLAGQIAVMLYSHLYEVVGGKIHYFVVPYALGLLRAEWRSEPPPKQVGFQAQ